jgi:CDP-diacylglycerol--glycerol-3-phosphate 3-phosphatidyltransferase
VPPPEKTLNPERVKQTYTTEARRLAARSMEGLAQTPLTPTALTMSGVLLCVAASVLVYFEYRNEYLFYWLGAAVFVLGSILDILDGALARAGGKTTPFGAFIDSTTDRIGEAFMLGAIGLVFSRQGNDVALAFAFAAVAGSFLVSYTRARAEALGLKGDVGFGSRVERVVIIAIALFLGPWGWLQWPIYVLAAMAWITVLQRILHVRTQLRKGISP